MNVKPAEGKLGILVVGCGAVATTFMTGVFMTRKGLAKPVGSMTQYDKIRVGKGADKKYLHYKDIVPLADLNDIVFGTWDVYPQNAYQAAMYAEVLKEKDINPVREELEKVVPMKAAFDKNYAKRLDGDNVKDCKTRWEMVEALRQDIRDFKAANNCDRIVVIWAASTEIYVPVDENVHGTLAALEAAMNDAQRLQPFLDQLVRITKFGIGTENNCMASMVALPVNAWIESYIHQNDTELITNLATAVQNKFLSKQTASERNSKFSKNDEFTRIMREQKEEDQQDLLIDIQRQEAQVENNIEQEEALAKINNQQPGDDINTGRGKKGRPKRSDKAWDENGNYPGRNNWDKNLRK